MQIIQHVTVMQVLTESSKDKLLTTFMQKKERLERECNQLYFQLKKHEKEPQQQDVISQFQKAIEKRQEKISNIDFQIQQLNTLPLGSEIKETEVDALIDIQIGDRWGDKTHEHVIVVKDGTVVEIRQG
ncbi:YlqD family protein [Bacillus sp. NPDC077027]|uniref:YlqD family protein n=1 Tax=Bacillus sp. NPDC077027 TaxID=3390548 RepID=UPI003D0145EB